MRLHHPESGVAPARVPTLTEVLDAAAPAEPLPVLVEAVEMPADAPARHTPSAQPWPDAQSVADDLVRCLVPQLEALVEARLRAAAAQVAQSLVAHARMTLADELRARVASAVHDALARTAHERDDPSAG
jgi:hypothetical protein